MLTILHGASFLKVLVILSANFALAKATGGTRFAVPVMWLFNAGVLLATEWYEGYAFANLHSGFAFLDTWRGVYPRWHVSFNITMLRLVSFSIDYHWACSHIGIADVGHSLPISPHENDAEYSQPGGELSDKKRAAVFHPRSNYTFLNYLSYALYAPLYIAGRYSPSTISCGRCAQLSLQSLVALPGICDLAISPKRHRATGDNAIRNSVLHHAAYDGNAHPCDARRCDQGRTRVERHNARPAFHDRLLESKLESHLRLAEGTVLTHVTPKQALMITSAATPMASLPPVGTHGRDGPSREHDTLHGKQLLAAPLLARMAPLIRPLDRALPLHPARRRTAPSSYQYPDIHVRCALA